MEKSAIYWSGESQNKNIAEDLESSSTSVNDEHLLTEMVCFLNLKKIELVTKEFTLNISCKY